MNQETKNIYPKLSNIIDPDRERSNWANLADAHPGRKQTTLYSYEALLLLNNLGHDLQ